MFVSLYGGKKIIHCSMQLFNGTNLSKKNNFFSLKSPPLSIENYQRSQKPGDHREMLIIFHVCGSRYGVFML